MMRAGHPGAVTGLLRLSGGANMQSWRFELGGEAFVLRRAPSDEWVATRQLDMAKEAEVIRVARAGVLAPCPRRGASSPTCRIMSRAPCWCAGCAAPQRWRA
jgi:aminoglycoside phosphotransferase (APT) family kinase protein